MFEVSSSSCSSSSLGSFSLLSDFISFFCFLSSSNSLKNLANLDSFGLSYTIQFLKNDLFLSSKLFRSSKSFFCSLFIFFSIISLVVIFLSSENFSIIVKPFIVPTSFATSTFFYHFSFSVFLMMIYA